MVVSKYNMKIIENLNCNITREEDMYVEIGKYYVPSKVFYSKDNDKLILLEYEGEIEDKNNPNKLALLDVKADLIIDTKDNVRIVSHEEAGNLFIEIHDLNNWKLENHKPDVKISITLDNNYFKFLIITDGEIKSAILGNSPEICPAMQEKLMHETENCDKQYECTKCTIDKYISIFLQRLESYPKDSAIRKGLEIIYPAVYTYISDYVNSWSQILEDQINELQGRKSKLKKELRALKEDTKYYQKIYEAYGGKKPTKKEH